MKRRSAKSATLDGGSGMHPRLAKLTVAEREGVLHSIRAAFGSRPDLPEGPEFVDEMKGAWARFTRTDG